MLLKLCWRVIDKLSSSLYLRCSLFCSKEYKHDKVEFLCIEMIKRLIYNCSSDTTPCEFLRNFRLLYDYNFIYSSMRELLTKHMHTLCSSIIFWNHTNGTILNEELLYTSFSRYFFCIYFQMNAEKKN